MEATMSQLEKLEQLAISLHCDVRNQEPMRKHTTFKIGGPADPPDGFYSVRHGGTF